MNEQLREVTFEEIKIGEAKPWSNQVTGKSGTMWNIGICIMGQWHNCTVFSDKALKQAQELTAGVKVKLLFYSEEYKGSMYTKFKFPYETDILRSEVDDLKLLVKLLLADNDKLKQAFVDAKSTTSEPVQEIEPEISEPEPTPEPATSAEPTPEGVEEEDDGLPF